MNKSILSILTLMITLGATCGDEGTPSNRSQQATDRKEGAERKISSATKVTVQKNANDVLLANLPPEIRRRCCVPLPEVDFASALKKAVELDKKELKQSREAFGVRPTKVQNRVAATLSPLVPPGLELEGWIFQVNWNILRHKGGSSKYQYREASPVTELTLRFPDGLGDYEIWLWGHNYNFHNNTYTSDNNKFAAIKSGDWVRVYGVLRNTSKVVWENGKNTEKLSIGELIISNIELIAVDREDRLRD